MNSVISNFDENKAINDGLAKHKSLDENVVISVNSTLKTYDVENGKYYFNVNIKEYNKISDTSYIYAETYEM